MGYWQFPHFAVRGIGSTSVAHHHWACGHQRNMCRPHTLPSSVINAAAPRFHVRIIMMASRVRQLPTRHIGGWPGDPAANLGHNR
jgi:hypothetical protein